MPTTDGSDWTADELVYTDASDDGGKFIRKEIAKFEKYHNIDEYSFTNYLDRINSTIVIHQGTEDTLVPVSWSRNIYGLLKNEGVDVDLEIYSGGDHNLQPYWNEVVESNVVKNLSSYVTKSRR